MSRSDATFFDTPNAFEAWLEKNHAHQSELIVGYYKKGTGIPSITWPESVDEALCFGWIDGIRRRIDDETYCIRFTPRRENSIWSAVNIKRVAVLTEQGRMRPTGQQAFERRTEAKSVVYAYEHHKDKPAVFSEEFAARLSEDADVAAFFEQQPPSYKKRAIYWVQSAKKQETRDRRMSQLIQSCKNGERHF